MKGVMMKPKMRLTLLACALGAASIATAQTRDIPPPNDVIRLPGSVTTPTMPVVVSPPRDDIGRGASTSGQSPPLVRSLGSESTLSDDDTLADGAATGGTDTTKRVPTTGQAGIVDSGDKPSNNADTAAADTGADAGANSSAADKSNMTGQNNQPGNLTAAPAGRPARTDAPADAPGASSGK